MISQTPGGLRAGKVALFHVSYAVMTPLMGFRSRYLPYYAITNGRIPAPLTSDDWPDVLLRRLIAEAFIPTRILRIWLRIITMLAKRPLSTLIPLHLPSVEQKETNSFHVGNFLPFHHLYFP